MKREVVIAHTGHIEALGFYKAEIHRLKIMIATPYGAGLYQGASYTKQLAEKTYDQVGRPLIIDCAGAYGAATAYLGVPHLSLRLHKAPPEAFVKLAEATGTTFTLPDPGPRSLFDCLPTTPANFAHTFSGWLIKNV